MNSSTMPQTVEQEWQMDDSKGCTHPQEGQSARQGNFRPISILFTPSKLLEKHVHNAFYSFLKFYNLFHLAQSGFRNLFSCESALLNILNKWTTAINNDNMNGAILLDLRKAFDLIDHDILIQKLRMYKCSDITIDLFTSYIKGRSQCTIYKVNYQTNFLYRQVYLKVQFKPFIVRSFY